MKMDFKTSNNVRDPNFVQQSNMIETGQSHNDFLYRINRNRLPISMLSGKRFYHFSSRVMANLNNESDISIHSSPFKISKGSINNNNKQNNLSKIRITKGSILLQKLNVMLEKKGYLLTRRYKDR